jgi:hypothetical protein
VPVPTNVVRLYNALALKSERGDGQLKYYHPGVGTEPGWWQHAKAGATGAGLNRNIMSAYQWLCANYEARDSIYLFGFSRGAYTTRSLAGLVAHCGLLDLAGVGPKDVWSRIERVFQRGYRDKRETRDDWKRDGFVFHAVDGDEAIRIHLVGVWDTVGALGIPKDLALLNLLEASDEHAFHDTSLSSLIDYGRHAVALDEKRASFQPTLWTGSHDGLKQVWFPGVHCDVGGGYRETGLSDAALSWMIEEARALGLGFEPDMIDEKQVRPDPRGVLHDSCTHLFKLLPTQPRSVPRLDRKSGGARAALHASVVERRRCPPISDAPYRATVPLLKAGESQTFTVYALDPWNATGLYVEAGVSYLFAADGEWLDRDVACGPAGTNDGEFRPAEIGNLIGSALGEAETLFKKLTKNGRADFRFTKRHERLGGARVPWFCLIGAVGNGGAANENGEPEPHEAFKIGIRGRCVPRASGYLYAYANDAWGGYANNRGSVTLTIKRAD